MVYNNSNATLVKAVSVVLIVKQSSMLSHAQKRILLLVSLPGTECHLNREKDDKRGLTKRDDCYHFTDA